VLLLARRASLLDNADAAGAWILEDDYDSELCQGVPLAALQGTVPHAPVVYLGTFSKTLYPALRLGFIVWPDSILDDVSARLAPIQTGGRTAEQVALAGFIRDGHFAIHVRHMRSLYARRQKSLRDALARGWPWPLAISGGQAGMHLAISLPAGAPDSVVVVQARQRGLGVRALSESYLPGSVPVQGLVLGYANLAEDRVDRHVVALVEAVIAAIRKASC
jgi:GntR family transcriptional regulator / MocR family aminotransferase